MANSITAQELRRFQDYLNTAKIIDRCVQLALQRGAECANGMGKTHLFTDRGLAVEYSPARDYYAASLEVYVRGRLVLEAAETSIDDNTLTADGFEVYQYHRGRWEQHIDRALQTRIKQESVHALPEHRKHLSLLSRFSADVPLKI